jgi:hypothetical protein
VDHSLGLAVVLPHPHLEDRPVGVDDGAGHLEAEYLAAQHAVFDDRVGTGGADDLGEGRDEEIDRRLRRERVGLGDRQRGVLDAPHRRRCGEGGCPAGEHAGLLVDEKVQVLDREAQSPEQCPSQGARRFLVSEDPARAVLDERRTTGKVLGAPVRLSPLPSDEGAQLGLAKALRPLGVGYFFFPPRAP